MARLGFFLASIVLLFCLAVTTVEGRSVPLIAQLTPEYTGRVNSNNRNLVGQAFTYLSTSGKDFHVSILVVSNIDPNQITKVQLYNVVDKELVGEKFTKLDIGYQVYDKRIGFNLGEYMNTEKIAVNIYTKEIGSDRPAISGIIVNNRTTFIAYLTADQEVTTPTGTSKNDGFATAIVWSPDFTNYLVSIVVNHDLDQTVTAIHLHAPAASNTNNAAIVNFPSLLQNAGKVLNFPINQSVYNWMSHHLSYVNIHTSKNTAGALRGQLIPTTTPRTKVPTFPNKATINVGGTATTFLPDGSTIVGDVGFSLKSGGARNLTGNATDVRVANFKFNATSASFDNDFRFALPVTIKNKYSLRGAVLYFTSAAEVADNQKYNLGLLDLNEQTVVNFAALPGTGRRAFTTFRINIDADAFPQYLGPGGIFATIQGTGLTGPGLYVDRFYVNYYVVNAYANNILKAIFYRGSPAE
jgi:hypothetical protein